MIGQRFAGFGHRAGGVGDRPAVVVVDMSVGFTDPASPLACELDGTIAATQRLLAAARRAGVPVIYTTIVVREADRVTGRAMLAKAPAMLTLRAGTRWVEVDERVAPRPDEPVLEKLFPSGFCDTSLASLLVAHGCDSVIVAGASTSGCVRATALDALQHGYRVIVAREAVGDRNSAAHDASLYDIDLKYGDVLSLDECLASLDGLGAERAADPSRTRGGHDARSAGTTSFP